MVFRIMIWASVRKQLNPKTQLYSDCWIIAGFIKVLRGRKSENVFFLHGINFSSLGFVQSLDFFEASSSDDQTSKIPILNLFSVILPSFQKKIELKEC